jgi:hypothetical protein
VYSEGTPLIIKGVSPLVYFIWIKSIFNNATFYYCIINIKTILSGRTWINLEL